MADQSPQVQEAAALQLAADALAVPTVEEPPVQGWFLWGATKITEDNIEDYEDTFLEAFGQ